MTAERCPSSTLETGSLREVTHSMKLPMWLRLTSRWIALSGSGSVQNFGFAGGDFAAVDPDPAVGADEFYAVALPVFLEHLPRPTVVQCGPHHLLDAIGPSQGGLNIRWAWCSRREWAR